MAVIKLVYASQTTTTVRPAGNITTGWTPTPSGAGTNYQRVDETAADDADYVQGQAASNDEYSMQSVNANAQRATNIQLRVRMTRQSSESCFLGTPTNVPLVMGIRLNGGTLQSVNKTIVGSNGTYSWYEQDFGGTFTQADIDTLRTYIGKTAAPSCGLGITQAVFRVSMVEAVITWQTPDLSQSAFRVYQNQNSLQPGAPLATTNAMADVQQNSQFRIRIGIQDSNTNWLTGSWGDHNNQYKLQYAQRSAASCSAQVSGWGDVTGATPIRYYTANSPADGAAISSNANDPDTGGSTKIYQSYEEANPISLTNPVNTGQTAIWDFSLTDASSAYGTVYCFRIVRSDNAILTGYTNFPSIVIVGSLDIDIVNAGGASVPSPIMPFGSVLVVDACQQSTATLGISSQAIRITNNIATNGWSLSMAATNGPTALWNNGISGMYDYNDSGGSPNGCTDSGDADTQAGRLTVTPSLGSLTPQSGCSSSGTALGTTASFSEGSIDSISLASATSSTPRFCYFTITGIGLAQQIPAWRSKGNYSLDFTLTVLAL